MIIDLISKYAKCGPLSSAYSEGVCYALAYEDGFGNSELVVSGPYTTKASAEHALAEYGDDELFVVALHVLGKA